MTAATSTRDSFERPDTGACIEPDVSITTRVPSSAGMLATVRSSVRPSARFQLSDGACLYAAHTWYGNSRALATSSGSVILAMTASIAASRDAGLVEVAQVADERHHAHRRDDRLPRLGVHAARQPARQPLPREAGLGQRGRTAVAQHRPTLVHRDGVERGGGRQHRQQRRVGDGVVVVATVEQPAEQRRLAVVAGRRVGQLDDVGHADLARQAVVAQRGPLVVEAADGVGDAALDRHRDVAAVASSASSRAARPARRRAAGRRATTDRPPAPPAATYSAAITTAAERMQHRLPQVLGQADLAGSTISAGDERRVRRGHLVDEVDEAGVAVGGALVEGVLADHVGGGQQEQLRLGVAQRRRRRPRRCGCARPSVRTGAVRLVRSGRRLVPENFDMTLSSLVAVGVVVMGPVRGQGGRAVPSRTAGARLPVAPLAKEGSPSFAADR